MSRDALTSYDDVQGVQFTRLKRTAVPSLLNSVVPIVVNYMPFTASLTATIVYVTGIPLTANHTDWI